MKTKIIKIITAIIMMFAISGSTLVHQVLAANSTICGNNHVPPEVQAAAGCPNNQTNDLSTVIVNILNGIIATLGIVAVIFIIIGGINYITSAGDAGKVKKARDTILYACIGLVICALAFAIVNFTIGIIQGNPGSGEESEATSLIVQPKSNVAFLDKSL